MKKFLIAIGVLVGLVALFYIFTLITAWLQEVTGMAKISKLLAEIIAIAIVLCGVFFLGCWYNHTTNKATEIGEIVEVPKKSGFDLRLPGEVERRVTTIFRIQSKIYAIGELSTYCGEYEVLKSVDESKYFLDNIRILGTKNTITINCTGYVKIGYALSEITLNIEGNTIYVKLPEPYVAENHILWDTIECQEKNSIFNPIEFSQYKDLINEIEAEGLAKVESDGIYDKADAQLKEIIRNFLDEFNNYKIVFE